MSNGVKLLIVGAGCFFGGALRYASELIAGLWINAPFADPLAVLIVNTLGCFIIGLFTAWVIKKLVSAKWNKFVTTGFCGGLTTFSSFAQGITALFMGAHIWVGIIYILANMLCGLFAVYLGLVLVMGKKYGEELIK